MNIKLATQYGFLEKCKDLIESKTWNINEPDDEGCYMLHWAAFGNHVDLVRYYLSIGAVVDSIGGDLVATPLHWAARAGHLKIVVLLLSHDAAPMLKDKNGQNAVSLSAAFDQPHCLAYILAKCRDKIDLNAVDNLKRSALMWSVSADSLAPMRILLNYGADPNQVDSRNQNILHQAIIKKNRSYVFCELICRNVKIDLEHRDSNGNMPSQLAEALGWDEIACLLKATMWHNRLDIRMKANDIQSKIKRIAQHVKYNNEWQQKFFALTPAALIIVVGSIVEADVSYYVKFYYFSLFFLSFKIMSRCCVRPSTIFDFVPVGLGLGGYVIFYWSFFYLCYSLQLESSSFFIEVIMWFGHVVLLLSYHRLLFKDPGIIQCFNKTNLKNVDNVIMDLAENDTLNDETFCYTCLIRRPLRSKHCAKCHKCIAKMDHHCDWVNNCIGPDNHKWFILHLLVFIIAVCWHMFGSVMYCKSKTSLPLNWDGSFRGLWEVIFMMAQASPWAFWLFLFGLINAVCVAILFCHQLQLLSQNITMNESKNCYRYKHFQVKKWKVTHPFRRGLLQNLSNVFGFPIPWLIQPTNVDWKNIYSVEEYKDSLEKET